MDSMNERLQNLMTTIRSTPAPTNDSSSNNAQSDLSSLPTAGTSESMDVDGGEGPLTLAEDGFPELPLGWRRLSERDGWRPSPIGVHVGGVVPFH